MRSSFLYIYLLLDIYKIKKYMSSKPSHDPVYKHKRVPKGEIKYEVTLDEDQKVVKSLIYDNQVVIVTGRAGSGKSLVCVISALDLFFKKQVDKILVTRAAIETGKSLGYLPGPQPLWCKVLTPEGWSTIGDLKIGDKIINGEGKSVVIKDKSGISTEDIYEVTTSDGRKTYCGVNHLFYTDTFYSIKQGKEGSVKSLHEIINSFYDINGKPNHYLLYNKPVEFNKNKELEIHPYVLGFLLGDGHFGNDIILSTNEYEIINKCKPLIEDNFNVKLKHNGVINYTISNPDFESTKVPKIVVLEEINTGKILKFHNRNEALKYTGFSKNKLNYRCINNVIENNIKYSFEKSLKSSTNDFKDIINKMNLNGLRSHNKFIPKNYLYNSSIQDRIELLRGLMDADGSNNQSCATFTTISPQLRDDVIELVRSLGGKVTYQTLNKFGKETNNIKSNFLIYELWINIDINPFYLSRKADKYNPKFKHKIKITNIEKIHKDKIQCLLLDSKDGLYITDDYIVTHNSMDEKFNPYLEAFMENVKKSVGPEKQKSLEGKIHAMPVQFIRGKTIDDILVVEETQNLTKHEVLAIITRLGKHGKIIFNGDLEQRDINGNGETNGLQYLYELSKAIPEIQLKKLQHQHRSDLVGKVLDWEYKDKT